MAVLKQHLTPLSKKGQIVKNAGKGASEQVLPNRSALSSLTSGDPGARTMNDYAKATPMANPNKSSPALPGLGSGSYGSDDS
jgi:hypothetical protein